MSSEGSPSVPQQPVERPEGFGERQTSWTLLACPECGRDNTSCLDRALVYHWRNCPVHEQTPWAAPPVEVVPALVAERLAGNAATALWILDGEEWEQALAEQDEEMLGSIVASARLQLRASLEAFRSGGATKPGEES